MAQQKTANKSGGKGRASKRSTKKNEASRASRSGSNQNAGSVTSNSHGDDGVAIDRRRNAERRDGEQASGEHPTTSGPQLERRKKVNRRRQIDPTTCERDYTDAEVEFMNALDDYKRKSGRMFPTCSEVLEVVRDLGYVKLQPAELEAFHTTTTASASSAKPMPADWPASSAPVELAGDDADMSSDQPLTY